MTAQTSRRHLFKGAAMLTAVPVTGFYVVGEPEPILHETSPVIRLRAGGP
jgi:hypothetical protein